MNLQSYERSVAVHGDTKWLPVTTNTASGAVTIIVNVNPFPDASGQIVSQTEEDVSWAFTRRFEARIESALRSVESGDFDTVKTIDELIDYIDAQAREAKE